MRRRFHLFIGIIFIVLSICNSAFAIIDEVVHFEPGSASIPDLSKPILNDVISILKNSPIIKLLRIEGHTDIREGKTNSVQLSVQRARAVKDFMIQQGIDPARLEITGDGNSRPMATNETERGRALNRRVEFKISKEERDLPFSPTLKLCQQDEPNELPKKDSDRENGRPHRFQKQGIEGVIFKRWLGCVGECGQCCHHSKFWTPSVKNILDAEKGVRECAMKYGQSDVDHDQRQYVGILYEKRKLLWVNLLSYPEGINCQDWTSKECDICRPNSMSMMLLYDMTNGQCYNFFRSYTQE